MNTKTTALGALGALALGPALIALKAL